MKSYSGLGAICLIVLGALGLWYAHASAVPLFSNFSVAARTLGRAAGIAGISLFAINLILAARLKFLELYFGGVPNLYVNHHSIGALAFGLLLFHPVFLGAQFLSVSIQATAEFFTPSLSNLPLLGGMAALLLMIGALVLTFYVHWAYPRWRLSHQTLGPAFYVASLHAFFIPSDISSYAPLFWYMLVLVSLAGTAFLYRSLFGRWLVRRYDYSVKEIIRRGDSIVEVALTPAGGQVMPYRAGQFAFLSFLSSVLSREPHPYSIITPEGEREVRFAIKKLGDYTGRLDKIEVGTPARLEGAYGKFAFMGEYQKRDHIWIAGGIGITPFLSMARALPEYTDRSVDLYYTVNRPEEAVYLAEFERIARNQKKFRVIPFYSSETGYLTAEKIRRESGDLSNREIYVCGPAPMMKSLRKQLVDQGVSNGRIHSEEFALL